MYNVSSEVEGNGLGNGSLVISSGYGSNFSPSLRRLPPLFCCCWCAWYVSTSFPMRATCQAACVFIYIKTIVPVPVLLFLTVPCADLRPERFGLLRDTCFFVITKKFRCSRLFPIFTCRITVPITPSLIPIYKPKR